METKNIIIIIALVILMTLAIYFGSGSQSTIDTFSTDSFSECRIILDGDMCEQYDKCYYSSVKKASCIKGYELAQQEDATEEQGVPTNSGGGLI